MQDIGGFMSEHVNYSRYGYVSGGAAIGGGPAIIPIDLLFFRLGHLSTQRGIIKFDWLGNHEPILAILLFLLGLFLPAIISSTAKHIANGCSLSLTKGGIQGVRKTLFSSKNLQLPIEKVDSIMVSKSIFNLIGGGKTVAIRSNSGLVMFPWVQNADDFVAATLQRIETFKKNTTPSSKPASDGASLSNKLKELQSLKEQGILTEEQFEAKKQELIAKY